jgi:hypothetical protein
MITARVLLDSLSPAGVRITTMEWTYPRFIHAEVMTYRMLSRNAASSRAIPMRKTIARVLRDPAGPVFWGRNQPGMQAREEMSGWRRWLAEKAWYWPRYGAIAVALLQDRLGLHKQVGNRALEPWLHITTILTGTEWDHIWRQRCHPDAQPEFRVLAEAAHGAYLDSPPVLRRVHAPLVHGEDWSALRDRASSFAEVKTTALKVSTARCARVSYLTHDGRRSIEADLDLFDKLATADPPHTSPFEHPCTAVEDPGRWSGNVKGWMQYRESVDPFFIRRESTA